MNIIVQISNPNILMVKTVVTNVFLYHCSWSIYICSFRNLNHLWKRFE